MAIRTAEREHEFCYGHTVTGHEGKCKHLHGHNGKVVFVVQASALDTVGRVVDFSVIKERLCNWLEDNWDHKFLVWEGDGRVKYLVDIEPSLVVLPFNPTAENLAEHLVKVVGPKQLVETGCTLVSVLFWETSKCCASYTTDLVEE